MAAAVACPDKMELIQRGTEIVIVRRWFNTESVLVAVFAVSWIAMVTMVMAGAGALMRA